MRLTKEQELTMEMAKVGYESYAAYTGNKSAVTGDDLPTWAELPGQVRNAWFASAEGMTQFLANVIRSLKGQNTELKHQLGTLVDLMERSDMKEFGIDCQPVTSVEWFQAIGKARAALG